MLDTGSRMCVRDQEIILSETKPCVTEKYREVCWKPTHWILCRKECAVEKQNKKHQEVACQRVTTEQKKRYKNTRVELTEIQRDCVLGSLTSQGESKRV